MPSPRHLNFLFCINDLCFFSNFYLIQFFHNCFLLLLKKSQNSDKYFQNGFVRFLGDIFFCTFIDTTQLNWGPKFALMLNVLFTSLSFITKARNNGSTESSPHLELSLKYWVEKFMSVQGADLNLAQTNPQKYWILRF